MSASSSAKTDDQSTSKTSKIDAKTMTKEKLATLTYTKDVTADFTVKSENVAPTASAKKLIKSLSMLVSNQNTLCRCIPNRQSC